MSKYILSFYVIIIAYPWTNTDDGLAYVCK